MTLRHKQLLNVSKEGIISNYLIYVLADIIESLHLFSENETRKAGMTFRNRDKALLNQLKFVVTDLRKSLRETSSQSQEEFGEASDDLLQLLLLTIDRAGENKAKYNMIVNFIKSINSEQNLNLKKFGINDKN